MDNLTVGVIASDAISRNQYIIQSICRAVEAQTNVDLVRHLDYGALVNECRERRFDVLLVVGGAGGFNHLLERAKRYVGCTILWTTEDPYEFHQNKVFAGLFDFVFTNDIGCAPLYKNGHFLPLAADYDIHYRPIKDKKDLLFDLFFVGTAWPERVSAINDILRYIPSSARLKIGLSSNPHLPPFDLGDLNEITNFRLSPREFASMANLSAVTLTLDRSFRSSNVGKDNMTGLTPPPRLFEVAASGSAQVFLNNGRLLHDLFDPASISEASSPSQVADLMTEMVLNDDLRRERATKAQSRVLKDHLYRHRIAFIFDVLNNRPLIRPGDVTKKSADGTFKGRKRNVLFVTHNILGAADGGGVEHYQNNLAFYLEQYHVLLLYFDRRKDRLCLADADGKCLAVFDVGSLPEGIIYDPLRERILYELVHEYDIQIVHFHHLIGHPLSLPLHVKALGVPSVFQMHDYYMVCREFNLIGMANRYCNVRDTDTAMCDICLSSRSIASPGSQSRRRQFMEIVASSFEVILHNTYYTYDKLLQIYPSLSARDNRVVGNTAKPQTLRSLIASRRNFYQTDDVLNIVILGNFTQQKGAKLLIEMFWQLMDERVNIFILGRIDDLGFRDLISERFANVKIVGSYTQDELVDILPSKHVSIHFSIWPETYCIGVDEAWAAGLVPIVMGLGALKERVRDGIDGFVIDPDHPYDLIKLVRRLMIDRARLTAMIVSPEVVLSRCDRHYQAVGDIYASLVGSRSNDHHPGTHTSISSRVQWPSTENLGFRVNSNRWNAGDIDFDDSPPIDRPRFDGDVLPPRADQFGLLSTDFRRAPFHQQDQNTTLVINGVSMRLVDDRAFFMPKVRMDLTVCVVTSTQLLCTRRLVLSSGKQLFNLFANEVGNSNGRYFSKFEITKEFLIDRREVFFLLPVESISEEEYLVAGPYLVDRGMGLRSMPCSDYGSTRRSDLETRKETRSIERVQGPKSSIAAPTKSSNKLLERLIMGAKSSISIAPKQAKWHIDSINGAILGSVANKDIRVSRADGFLAIRGWYAPARKGMSYDFIEYRFVSNGVGLFGDCKLVERGDLVNVFGRPELLNSGIEISLEIRDLTESVYIFELIGRYRSGGSHATDVGRLIVD